jgi:flagellar hook assembly protein FlgD
LGVRISVTDISGRSVMTKPLGTIEAGSHRYLLDGSGLSNGAYVLRLETYSQSVVERILLLK